MNAVANIVEAVPGDKGLGVFHWEATWTAVTGNGWDPTDSTSGNGWENQALISDYDKQGHLGHELVQPPLNLCGEGPVAGERPVLAHAPARNAGPAVPAPGPSVPVPSGRAGPAAPGVRATRI